MTIILHKQKVFMTSKLLIALFLTEKSLQITQIISTFNNSGYNILIIDDGTTETLINVIEKHPPLVIIKHAEPIGTGACFISAYQYAKDFGYETLITMNFTDPITNQEIETLLSNLQYGYDIVNLSRILENFEYPSIPNNYSIIMQEISESIQQCTGYDITDPLSEIKAYSVNSLVPLELTDFSHGAYIQLWIQAYHYGMSVFEIPALSDHLFGQELELYDEPSLYFLSIIHTEKYLYPDTEIQ